MMRTVSAMVVLFCLVFAGCEPGMYVNSPQDGEAAQAAADERARDAAKAKKDPAAAQKAEKPEATPVNYKEIPPPAPLTPEEIKQYYDKDLQRFDSRYPLEAKDKAADARLKKIVAAHNYAKASKIDCRVITSTDPAVETFYAGHGSMRISTGAMKLLNDKEVLAVVASCAAFIQTPYSLDTVRKLKYEHEAAIGMKSEDSEIVNEPLQEYYKKHDTAYLTATCGLLSEWKVSQDTYISAVTKLGEGKNTVEQFQTLCPKGK